MITMWCVQTCGLNSLVVYLNVKKTYDIWEESVTTKKVAQTKHIHSPMVVGYKRGNDITKVILWRLGCNFHGSMEFLAFFHFHFTRVTFNRFLCKTFCKEKGSCFFQCYIIRCTLINGVSMGHTYWKVQYGLMSTCMLIRGCHTNHPHAPSCMWWIYQSILGWFAHDFFTNPHWLTFNSLIHHNSLWLRIFFKYMCGFWGVYTYRPQKRIIGRGLGFWSIIQLQHLWCLGLVYFGLPFAIEFLNVSPQKRGI